ncbi:cbb3-type cytochrome c oxidase subunit I [Flavobacterium sp. C3NV]|uniref:cbb3-type cytochrome c oxidase subunit I n=1 Tax=Flavobacterium sp. C3NV TaxID=3393358 RepID=UPI00398F9F69
MTIKNIKVYHLFWFVAVISLLTGLFNPDETLDINIHDTYFVIASIHMAVLLFVFYFINGFAYWLVQKLLKKPLLRYLTLIHSVIVIGSYIFYWLILLYCKLFLSNSQFPLFDDGNQLINISLVLEFMLTIFVAVPIFIVNLSIAIFRKSN